MPLIYIVEDDENIRGIVSYALKVAGHEAACFECGEDFLQAMKKDVPALILLDIMLPGENGLGILKKLKNATQYRDIPVIMLTARGSELDKVTGLDGGADDYIVKPFGVMELISRVGAVLRRGRTESEAEEILKYENIRLDINRRTLAVDDTPVLLTFKEYELLYFLLRKQGLAQSRSSILSAVWDSDFEGESRTLDMHIRSLRKKLGPAGTHIKTVRNVGYKLGE